MRKLILLIILYLLTEIGAKAQEFLFSAGTSVSVMYATLAKNGQSGRFGMTHVHLNAYPRYSVPVGENSSLDAGTLLGLGAGIMNSNFMQEKGTNFSLDIPIIFNYNVGFKAIPASEDEYGFYFGAGYSFTKTFTDTLSVTKFHANSRGILARVGIRLAFSSDDEKRHGISFGLSFRRGLDVERYKTYGVNVLYDF